VSSGGQVIIGKYLCAACQKAWHDESPVDYCYCQLNLGASIQGCWRQTGRK